MVARTVKAKRSIIGWSIAIHPNQVIGNKADLAKQLATLIPERGEGQYYALLNSGGSFAWLRRRARPELVKTVNALGEPGIEMMREPDRLLRITSVDDWLALCRAHPLDVTFARRHDWTRATGERHAWIVPDWAAVAAHHDAVHLDVRCWLEGAGRALRIDGGSATVIAGWSPDATCWLRDPQPVEVCGQAVHG